MLTYKLSRVLYLVCAPPAIEALEPKRRTPHKARPGAITAWKVVVCTISRALRLTTAKADNAHKTEHAMLRDVTMLCKKAWSSPPAASASRETRSTFWLQYDTAGGGWSRWAPHDAQLGSSCLGTYEGTPTPSGREPLTVAIAPHGAKQRVLHALSTTVEGAVRHGRLNFLSTHLGPTSDTSIARSTGRGT